jgi:hypothetical protein
LSDRQRGWSQYPFGGERLVLAVSGYLERIGEAFQTENGVSKEGLGTGIEQEKDWHKDCY